jgi:putative two-component system response regulator
MAIADVYDALISKRPYKETMPPEEAAKIIMAGGGSQFEPALVKVFLSVSDDFANVAQKIMA